MNDIVSLSCLLMSHQSLKLIVAVFVLRVILINVILFQRIDLRDNGLKVAGLMALARSMKVNTSVTQLDLDGVPKKRTVCFICSLRFDMNYKSGFCFP